MSSASAPPPVSDVLKIWIRADYIRVYEYAESIYGLCYHRRKAQAVVVTAHPELVSVIIYTFRLPLLSLSTKERQCDYCMHYVGAVPKRNRSYGTMELTALFSLMTVFTKWLRIFKTTSLRSSCGLLSIRTRCSPWRPTTSRPESHPSFRQLRFFSRQAALETPP
jgi:hypothetical protein